MKKPRGIAEIMAQEEIEDKRRERMSIEQDEPNVANIIGIPEEEAREILKMLEGIQVHEEGIYPLLKAATEKFGDKKSMFVGWVLGHMVARMSYTDECSCAAVSEARDFKRGESDMIMMDGAIAMIESLKADRMIPDDVDKVKAASEAIRRYCDPMSAPIQIIGMQER